MKSFFNILNLNKELYNLLGMNESLPIKDRLGSKDHRSLSRHQAAYSEVQSLLFEHVNAPVVEALILYLNNANYFLKSLNANFWHTHKTEDECIDEHKGSTAYYLWKLIQSWEPGMNPKPMKDWIKQSIKAENKHKTPLFTAAINDIRESVQGHKTIRGHLKLLETDLNTPTVTKKKKLMATRSLKGVYQAVMIIHRIYSNGGEKRLTQIKKYINRLVSYGDTPFSINDDELLITHQDLALHFKKERLSSWSEHHLTHGFNDFLDNQLAREKPRMSLKLMNHGTSIVWPNQETLTKVLNDNKSTDTQTELDSIMLRYYQMYYYAGNGQHKEAFELCLKILQSSTNIHLGEIQASLLIHKTILGYEVAKMTIHNQFNGLMADLAFSLPDRFEPGLKLHKLFADNETLIMRSLAYRLYNKGHPEATISPLKNLEFLCEKALEVVDQNPNTEAKKLLPELKVALDNKMDADTQLLPFTKELTPKMALNDLIKLGDFYINQSVPIFHKLKENKICEELISHFFRIKH